MNEYEQKIADAEEALIEEVKQEEITKGVKHINTGYKVAQEQMQSVRSEAEIGKENLQLKKAEKVQLEKSKYFDPIAYAHFKTMAQDFIEGGAISADVKTPQQMILKFQAGFELGLSPVEALNSLYIVSGRISFWGAALVRRLRLFGWHIAFKEQEDECEATITKGDETYTDKITFAEAEASGYTKSKFGQKAGWIKGTNRKLKLRYGALSTLVKTYVPEVLGSAAGIAEIDMVASIDESKENEKEKMEQAIREKMKASTVDASFKAVTK